MYYIQHCFICHPPDSTVSVLMGSNPGLLWLWQWQSGAPTTWLELIHSQTMAFLTEFLRDYKCKVLYVGKGRLQVYCIGEFASWGKDGGGRRRGKLNCQLFSTHIGLLVEKTWNVMSVCSSLESVEKLKTPPALIAWRSRTKKPG